jgi:hypothetical protein
LSKAGDLHVDASLLFRETGNGRGEDLSREFYWHEDQYLFRVSDLVE